MAGVKMSEKKYVEALPLLRRAARICPGLEKRFTN
jgi:hypothetical protein